MPIVLLTEQERLGSTVAGRYRLETVLGAGGMAVVFKAKHTWTGRGVAVKFLDPRKTKDVETASRRFLKEGRVIGALKHPNVVKVLDMGRDEHGIVFQVLELLTGHTLASRLDDDGRLTAQETIDSILPIMDALTAAHEMEIIHRDLKPENIFISSDESGAQVPKLLDFGVAKGLDDETSGNLTREGSVLGTPYYMAPEQAKGASTVGPAADVFSLAIVIFECLVGDLPYGDRDPAEYAVWLLSADVPPLSERAPRVDEGIASAVDRALLRRPQDRYPSMLEFRQALAGAAEKAGLTVPKPAVFTPEARAALIAMREDTSSVDTLGDGTLLSDLIAGEPGPHRTSTGRILGVAALALVAAVIAFIVVAGADDDAAATSVPVASEPEAIHVEPTPALEEESMDDAAVVEDEGVDEALDEEPVIRRLAVKRTAFPRDWRPRMDATMGGEEPEAPAIEEESGDSSMRPDRPNVVREF